MVIYSVFTPYYSEDVIYSPQQLAKENDDGISMMYYLRTIVPGLFPQFLALERWNASQISQMLYVQMLQAERVLSFEISE